MGRERSAALHPNFHKFSYGEMRGCELRSGRLSADTSDLHFASTFMSFQPFLLKSSKQDAFPFMSLIAEAVIKAPADWKS